MKRAGVINGRLPEEITSYFGVEAEAYRAQAEQRPQPAALKIKESLGTSLSVRGGTAVSPS